MKPLLPLLLLAAAPATAQAPNCPAAAPFMGFERAVPLAASPSRRATPLPTLGLGQAATVALAPTARLLLETPTEHAAAPQSFGGMVELRVPLSGVYRVALDGRAWIDLTRGGKLVASGAHGHGPDCGPIRKIVDFQLDAGTYTLQFSDAAKPVLTVMVAPAP